MEHKNKFAGEERRKSGQIKLSPRDWYTLLIVIIGATLWLGKLSWTASAQGEKIEKVEKAPQDIALMQKDMSYMQRDIQEIQRDVSGIDFKLDRILDRMPKKI